MWTEARLESGARPKGREVRLLPLTLIGDWCNGNMPDSDSGVRGSNP